MLCSLLAGKSAECSKLVASFGSSRQVQMNSRDPPSTVVKLNEPLVLLLRLAGPLLMYGTGRLQFRLVTPDQAGL